MKQQLLGKMELRFAVLFKIEQITICVYASGDKKTVKRGNGNSGERGEPGTRATGN